MAVETAQDGLPAGALALGINPRELGGECLDEWLGFGPARLRTLLRRHLSKVELVENGLPGLQGLKPAQVGSEGIKAALPLLLPGTVAIVAVLLQEGFEPRENIVPDTRARENGEQKHPSGSKKPGLPVHAPRTVGRWQAAPMVT